MAPPSMPVGDARSCTVPAPCRQVNGVETTDKTHTELVKLIKDSEVGVRLTCRRRGCADRNSFVITDADAAKFVGRVRVTCGGVQCYMRAARQLRTQRVAPLHACM